MGSRHGCRNAIDGQIAQKRPSQLLDICQSVLRPVPSQRQSGRRSNLDAFLLNSQQLLK
jgi:hypothetical protein